MRRPIAFVASLALALGLVAQAETPARAAGESFGTPTALARYGDSIVFTQPVSLAGPIRRAEILLTFPGSGEPFVQEVALASGNRPSSLAFTWSLAKDGHIVPNTRITAAWRVTYTDASLGTATGPAVSVLYADTRFGWKTLAGSLVRLHWYSGDDAFAKRALKIGEDGVRNAAALLGVTETDPIDFFVYADQQSFYDALGPGTRENVGGEAHADIRTMFALITPDEIAASWVGIVIPHELTHLVFDTAVHNDYHFPPRWLNEGLAVYLTQGFDASDRAAVAQAAGDGSLMPLDGLVAQFPTSRDGFFLAYAESVSAVDFMVRTYGKPALVKVIRSYAAGVTDDEAFAAGLGVDVAAFQAAWLTANGAGKPQQYGPQPGAPGPVPSGWGTNAAPIASAPASPSASSGPLVVVPAGSPSAGSSPPPDAGGATGGGDSGLILVVLVVAGVAVGAAIALWTRRRAAPGPPG